MFIEKRDYQKAEQCFIQAKKVELSLKMYTDLGMFPEALRVARVHAPHLINEINNKYMSAA